MVIETHKRGNRKESVNKIFGCRLTDAVQKTGAGIHRQLVGERTLCATGYVEHQLLGSFVADKIKDIDRRGPEGHATLGQHVLGKSPVSLPCHG